MLTLLLMLSLGQPAQHYTKVHPDFSGVVPGDVLLVYVNGDVVDLLDHCKGNKPGEMQLLSTKTGVFQICVDMGEAGRYWLPLPRKERR